VPIRSTQYFCLYLSQTSLSFSSDNFLRFAGISATSVVHSTATFSDDIQFLLSSMTDVQCLPSASLSAESVFVALWDCRTFIGRLSTLRKLDIETEPALAEQRTRVGELAMVVIGADDSLRVGDSSFENSFICTNMFDWSVVRDGECSFVVTSCSLLSTLVDDDEADKADLLSDLREE